MRVPRGLSASDVLGAFASSEELWRAATLRRASGAALTTFGGSWKASCIAAARAAAGLPAAPPPARRARGVAVYSDTLYRPHEVRERTTNPPKQWRVLCPGCGVVTLRRAWVWPDGSLCCVRLHLRLRAACVYGC